jgi:DNA-binding transcriptional MerR regulator
MKAPYTKKHVSDLLDMPYRSVQFFTEQHVVVPENKDASGRGRFRLYSNRDLVSLLIAGELANYGVTVGEIKKVVGEYNELMPEYIGVIKFLGLESWRKRLEDYDVPQAMERGGELVLHFGKGKRGIGRKLLIAGNGLVDNGPYTEVTLWLCTNGEGERLVYGVRWRHGEQEVAYVDREKNVVNQATLDRFWGKNAEPESSIVIPLHNHLSRIQERIG